MFSYIKLCCSRKKLHKKGFTNEYGFLVNGLKLESLKVYGDTNL